MISHETRLELGCACTDLTLALREIAGPDASPERQMELMQEVIALLLAGHMFAAERQLHLGPRTEALRVSDRAHALYEQCCDGADAAMRGAGQ